jgi:iron complex transport system ATP-binding protein
MSAILEARNLSVEIGGKTILRDLSLSFPAGRFVALLGPNGAGKTTALKAMAGLIPARGSVTLQGENLARLAPRERARRIGYLPQGHAVHWPLSARDVVALGRYPHGVADPAKLSQRDAEAVDCAMARTDCAHLADQPVQTLSGGERARVMLARVLATEAPILLADEPTAALDPRHQITVMDDLKGESRRGALVIAVTHDIALAARMADEIVLLHEGRLIAHGPPDDVLTDANLAEIYGVSVARPIIDGQPTLLPWRLS